MNKLKGFFNNHKAKKEKQENHSKNYTSLIQKTSAKVFAFILVILMTILTVACTIGAVLFVNLGVYTTLEVELLESEYSSIARNDAEQIICDILENQEGKAQKYCLNRNISSIRMTNRKNEALFWDWSSDKKKDNGVKIDLTYYMDEEVYKNWNLSHKPNIEEIKVSAVIFDKPVFEDNYMLVNKAISFAYAMRYWVYVIGLISLLTGIVSFVFLLCASGHKRGYEGVQPGWGTKIPFDFLTAIIVFAIFFTIITVWVEGVNNYNFAVRLPIVIISGIAMECAFIGWSMSLALRVKLGKWWENTVIYRVLVFILKILKRIVKMLLTLCKCIAKFFVKLPLIRKTVLAAAVITLIEFIFILYSWNEMGRWMRFWFIEKLVLIPIVFYSVIVMRKLQKGGTALAQGNLSYQVDTSKMLGDFKRHGESLNSIAEGMTKAVEQRLKSERFKTELITNVSHDIKTPLTSIINYADLISKEPCDNNKITEYSDVLLRQSERLKKLIDDLVEASKASTGNLEVLLAPCEANILLTQIAGEYEQKMQSKNLELITVQAEKPIMIMADGRRMLRVFDNLMNNIFKYAQSGTRVYLSLEKQGDQAVITFKNTSCAPLNLSADELMERFVRGDKSRNTEGNGLGLSIAKSLTELQKGSLELAIDGDLFKVTLRFPIIK